MKKNLLNKLLATATAATIAFGTLGTTTSAMASDIPVAVGESIDNVFALNYGNSYVTHFNGGHSQDWYSFTANGSNCFYELTIKNFNIETGGNWFYGFHAYIMTEFGEIIADIDTHKDCQNIERFKLPNDTDTYYIKLELGDGLKDNDAAAHSGNYRIMLKTVADDCGDTMKTAKAISNRKTYSGKMNDWVTLNTSKRNADTGRWTEAANTEMSDVDYYKFTAPKSGYYTLKLTNCNMPSGGNDWHQLNANIFTTYEEKLASVSSPMNSTNSVSVKLTKGQTYFIKIFLGQCVPTNLGNYKLNITDNDYTKSLAAATSLKTTIAKKKITVSWKKQTQIASYIVYRSINGGAYKKIATVTKGTYVDTKVSKGKKYQYKIIAYKMTDGTNVSSLAKSAATKRVTAK